MNSNSSFLPAPPPMNDFHRRHRGGVLGANDNNYRNMNFSRNYYMNNPMNRMNNPMNQMNYPINPMNYPINNFNRTNIPMNTMNYPMNNFNRANIPMDRMNDPMNRLNNYRNMNYRMNSNGFSRNNRVFHNRNGPHNNYNRPNSGNRNQPMIQRQRSRSRQSGPRALRLNDFMPAEFRDESVDSNPRSHVASAAHTRPQTPIDALPQRPIFAAATTNETQPFDVNERQDAPQNERATTSSFRRRERRVRQRQYRQMTENGNRFSALSDEAGQRDIDNDLDFVDDDRLNVKSLKGTKMKTRKRLYLEHNRIMSYLQKNFSTAITSRGNQAYVLAASPIYDEWIRNNYELQVWQAYLKMGTEQKHWAKEVIQRTKRRDDTVCTRFVQKKINQLLARIAKANATISDLQIQLNIYWAQLTTSVVPPTGQGAPNTAATTSETMVTTTTSNRNRDPVDRIERIILKYIHQCTQHIKQLSENKVKLAKAQLEEYKALQDFEQIATPSQWNVHLTLKTKMKLWSTKNKNLQMALKRVEYDLPPKFIAKMDFNFKIDETIIGQEEAQELYNQMRQVTKDLRVKSMTVYVQALNREHELLSNEIKQMIEGFPKENENDRPDSQPSMTAFKYYQELREKRMNLETEQSIYFLEEQRVEGEINNPEESLVVAPALTRSLGEDFLLQL